MVQETVGAQKLSKDMHVYTHLSGQVGFLELL